MCCSLYRCTRAVQQYSYRVEVIDGLTRVKLLYCCNRMSTHAEAAIQVTDIIIDRWVTLHHEEQVLEHFLLYREVLNLQQRVSLH